MVIAVLGLAQVPRLEVDADSSSLLPRGGERARALGEVLDRFASAEQLYFQIGYFDETPEALEAASKGVVLDALHRLEEKLLQSSTFSEVRIGPREDDERFLLEEVLPRAPLLLSDDEFEDFVTGISSRESIGERAAVLRRRISAPNAGLQSLLRSDPFGLAPQLLSRAAEGLPSDPWTGAFVAPNGLVGLAIATPDLTGRRPPELLAEVEALGEELRQELDPAGQLELRPLGGALYAAWDETALRNDLSVTLTVSLTLSLLALALGLRSLWIPLTAGLTLACAAAMTLGLLTVSRGSIVALGFGFSAVLVGLGVDALIHGAARWRLDGVRDVIAAARDAGPGIVAALATSAVAFLGLQLGSLQVVRDVGFLVGVGLVAVLLATLLVSVPLARLAEQRNALASGGVAPWLVALSEGLRRAAEKRPAAAVAVFVLLCLTSLWLARSVAVRADVTSLRSAEHPASESERSLADNFGLGADTLQFLVRGEDLGEALERAAGLTATLRSLPEAPKVQSPTDLLGAPASGAERRRALAGLPLHDIRRDFEDALRSEGLAAQAFASALQDFENLAESSYDWAPAELPSWLQQQIVVDEAEATVLLNLRVASPEESLVIADRFADPRVTPVSAALVGADLEAAVQSDLRTLVTVSGASVLGLLLLSFRGRWSLVGLALLPVLFGVAVALASLVLVGRPLDLLGVAMLPVLLGLGIDDGIHGVMHADGPAGIGERVRLAGPAMTLTTLTTCLGFASLALSEIPSLGRAGLFIAVGVLACWLTTVTLLPALGALRRS